MCSLQHWRSIRRILPGTSDERIPERWGSGRARVAGVAVACLVGALALLAGCASPGDAPKVVKVGLIAPFEGTDRTLGYAVLPAAKATIATANRDGRLGPYRVALVALNDDSDARGAAAEAGALAVDPEVLAVLGPWAASTAGAAAPVLDRAGLPALVAASLADRRGVVRSLCPPPSALAAELAVAARNSGAASVSIGGSDARLAEAAGELLIGAFRVSPDAEIPCPPSAEDSGRSDCVVIYAGDASGLADDLQRWKASGWEGATLAGPDVARSWFPARAGDSAEGVRALVCAWSGRVPVAEDSLWGSQAGLAVLGSELVLEAIARDIAAHGAPSRHGVAAALAQMQPESSLGWIEVQRGSWIPVTSPAPAP